MALSIKNDEVERLARELARRRNVSITEAIRQSLEREVEGDQILSEQERSKRLAKMIKIAKRAGKIPRISDMSDDEILGYDEHGVPSR